jgi:murein DD-endopeptidase MepM/ murein hydrolase activator NlpD
MLSITPPEQKAGEIYAAHDGIAYVYNKCRFRKNEYKYHNLDGCGSGYGNHVRIVHPAGYLTIYAHLSYITIKHKSIVRSGDKIGTEGLSGNAGKRHLHFCLHRPNDISLVEKTPGYVGASIPFNMKLMLQGKERLVSSEHIPCSNELGAPLLYGV